MNQTFKLFNRYNIFGGGIVDNRENAFWSMVLSVKMAVILSIAVIEHGVMHVTLFFGFIAVGIVVSMVKGWLAPVILMLATFSWTLGYMDFYEVLRFASALLGHYPLNMAVNISTIEATLWFAPELWAVAILVQTMESKLHTAKANS